VHEQLAIVKMRLYVPSGDIQVEMSVKMLGMSYH
jgi:hypothetical protein